jgi:hypothetical protein
LELQSFAFSKRKRGGEKRENQKEEKKKKEKVAFSPGQTSGCAHPSLHWDFPSYYVKLKAISRVSH